MESKKKWKCYSELIDLYTSAALNKDKESMLKIVNIAKEIGCSLKRDRIIMHKRFTTPLIHSSERAPGFGGRDSAYGDLHSSLTQTATRSMVPEVSAGTGPMIVSDKNTNLDGFRGKGKKTRRKSSKVKYSKRRSNKKTRKSKGKKTRK